MTQNLPLESDSGILLDAATFDYGLLPILDRVTPERPSPRRRASPHT